MLDYFGATLALVIFSPIMIITVVLIKLSSPGPILFRQLRHGKNNQVFEILKFRSMVIHDDEEVKQATQDDNRFTFIGKFIRKTSIDELPQLLNVLKGEMSLVGPRPHAVEHNIYYAQKISQYMHRHDVKPGMTGLAQINGYRGETSDLASMKKRVDYDLQYINSLSLWTDMRILLITIKIVLKPLGTAY